MPKLLLLFLLCFGIGSCANVPLTTLLTLSSYNQIDLLNIHPESLEVGVILSGRDIGINSADLEIKFQQSNQTYSYLLTQISKSKRDKTWYSSLKTQYNFKLDDDSVLAYRKLLSFLEKEPKDNLDNAAPSFSAAIYFNEPIRPDEVILLSVTLSHPHFEQPLTLFNEVPIKTNASDQ